MLKQFAAVAGMSALLVGGMALPATAAPATTDDPPVAEALAPATVTAIGRYANRRAEGAYVGIRVTYACDPASDFTQVNVIFRQVINGRVYSATKYFNSSQGCVGRPITETIRVAANDGAPAWRYGRGTTSVRVYTADYDLGESSYSNTKSRILTVTNHF